MTDRRAEIFGYAVTAVLAFAGGWYVLTQGSSIPIGDEWDLLFEWVGSRSTGEWALQHHGEHRFPLPKLLWLAGLRATGYDFRAVQFLTLALLTATGILLMWTARRLRGRQHPVDAIFPALTLHWAHGFNLIMSFQLGFALVAYALAGWLWCAGRAADGRVWRLGSVLYPLLVIPCGGFGITFAPAYVGWCAWLAWRERRSWFALVPLVAALASAGYTAWVVMTMPLGLNPITSPFAEPLAFLAAVVGSLSVAVGTWPVGSVAGRWLVGIAVVALYAVALVRGTRRFRANPTPLSVALLAVMVGSLLTAAATAYARGTGYAERMADASAVGLAAAWLAAFGTWDGARWLSAGLVLAVAGGLFWANYIPGLNFAIQQRHLTWNIRNDLRAGVPPSVLTSRYGHSTAVVVGPRMEQQIPVFRKLGLPDFRNAADEPATVAVPVAGLKLPIRVAFPAVTALELPAPPPNVFALRFRAHTPAAITRERVTLVWTDAATGRTHEAAARPLPSVGDSLLIYPLHGKPTDFRLRPDQGITGLQLIAANWLLHAGVPPP